jgi:hypothetical protein
VENKSIKDWMTEKMNVNAGYYGQVEPTVVLTHP